MFGLSTTMDLEAPKLNKRSSTCSTRPVATMITAFPRKESFMFVPWLPVLRAPSETHRVCRLGDCSWFCCVKVGRSCIASGVWQEKSQEKNCSPGSIVYTVSMAKGFWSLCIGQRIQGSDGQPVSSGPHRVIPTRFTKNNLLWVSMKCWCVKIWAVRVTY